MKEPAKKIMLTGLAHHVVKIGLLEETIVNETLQQSAQDKIPFIIQLVKQKLVDPTKLALAASAYFGLPLFDIRSFNAKTVSANFLKLDIVQKRYALPLFIKDKLLYTAVADPAITGLSEIKFITGVNSYPIVVEADKLEQVIDELFTYEMAAMDDLDDEALEDIDVTTEEMNNAADAADLANAPIVRFINKILLDGINKGASDIHFEPYENKYRIRFRQDGLLYEISFPPAKLANYFASRLKIMANLDISERRVPQDGRFKLRLSKTIGATNFRMSTCPTLWGEKVVMRILSASNELLNIDKLGMEDFQKKQFIAATQRPQGMILATGPTGSGKTVTLYTALRMLNTQEKNLSSVEDPIEMHVDGINQVQVNLKTGLTFSSALRAFLRQDPDVIMVGEIRDLETAEIAVKASQTGHLVLSTLHTNSAPETLVRLSNMGVAAFNIASSISLIIAQRLVRKLCDHCKHLVEIPKATLLEEGFREEELAELKLYGPGHCDRCMLGYKGRVGIYEVMPISEAMGQLIMSGGSAMDIAAQARKEGIPNLRESGLVKVRQGITSLEEINRVIKH